MCAKVLGREAWLQGMRAGGQKQGQVDKLPPPSGPAIGALGVSLVLWNAARCYFPWRSGAMCVCLECSLLGKRDLLQFQPWRVCRKGAGGDVFGG